ncbi:hypothetical protein SYJ56_22655 [Algoriphagus sp. D3-2-R+10]|nr:hypothetical protein [Algoriphagus sp. D3-2-R+10]MEB2778131.1 hypothetical protein [Algoriphagus sp. D3-2-R+10]
MKKKTQLDTYLENAGAVFGKARGHWENTIEFNELKTEEKPQQ